MLTQTHENPILDVLEYKNVVKIITKKHVSWINTFENINTVYERIYKEEFSFKDNSCITGMYRIIPRGEIYCEH